MNLNITLILFLSVILFESCGTCAGCGGCSYIDFEQQMIVASVNMTNDTLSSFIITADESWPLIEISNEELKSDIEINFNSSEIKKGNVYLVLGSTLEKGSCQPMVIKGLKSIKEVESNSHSETDKTLILGAWTNHQTENANFGIYADSIFFVEALKSYRYVVENDSIKIFYDEFIELNKILKSSRDSLILENELGILRLGRFDD